MRQLGVQALILLQSQLLPATRTSLHQPRRQHRRILAEQVPTTQVQQTLVVAVPGAQHQWQLQSKRHPVQAQWQASTRLPLVVMLALLLVVWACEEVLGYQSVVQAPTLAVTLLVLWVPGHNRHHGLAHRVLRGVRQREALVWALRVNAVDRSCQT